MHQQVTIDMNLPDAEIIRHLRAGTIDEERLARYLLENFTALQMARELANMLITEQARKPIVLTKEQLEQHIRIQGYRFNFEEGRWEKEPRGKVKKED